MYNPQLKVLVTVADCGSFNRAAEALYLTSTALMKQINGLEDHLRLKLLVRSPRGVKLTPEGEIIYRYAKEMFTLSKLAISEAAALSSQRTYAVRVGTSLLYPGHSFMALWFALADQFKNCTLNLVPFDDAHETLTSVIESLGEKYDFICGLADSRQWLDRCNSLIIGRCRHILLVRKDHPLASRGSIDIEDLSGQTVMAYRRGDSEGVDRMYLELERLADITIEEVPQFYDITVFNRAAETGTPLLAPDSWSQVHPALIPVKINWDKNIRWYNGVSLRIMYSKKPPEVINHIVDVIAASKQLRQNLGEPKI